MKKLTKFLKVILLVFLPATSFSQDWSKLPVDNTGDVLLIREEFPGKIAFLVDEGFISSCAPPTQFSTFSSDGKIRDVRTITNVEIYLGSIVYLSLQPFESESLGPHYRFSIFSEKSARSLLITYFPEKKKGALVGEYALDLTEAPETTEEIVVYHDHRTPPHRLKALEEKEKAAKEPPVEFDDLEFEYEYNDDHLATPDWVYSLSSNGRSYKKRVGFFDTGFRPGDGHTIAKVLIQVTPYSVKDGEKVYRFTLVFPDGKRMRYKVFILTDKEKPF